MTVLVGSSSSLHPHRIPPSLLTPHTNPNPPNQPLFLLSSTSITPSIVNSISEISEIRVCTNRTCRRQGSIQTLETLAGIAPPTVSVKSCGCLGLCGSGPNIVALPGPVLVSHVGTPVRAAAVMMKFVGGGSDLEEEAEAGKCLEALALRKRAEVEFANGNCSESESLYSQVRNSGGFLVAILVLVCNWK